MKNNNLVTKVLDLMWDSLMFWAAIDRNVEYFKKGANTVAIVLGKGVWSNKFKYEF